MLFQKSIESDPIDLMKLLKTTDQVPKTGILEIILAGKVLKWLFKHKIFAK